MIPENDTDLLQTVREVGIEEEELDRATIAKKSMAHPQKEKEKEAVPKGKMEQKAAKATEKEQTPAKGTGGTGPAVKDKYPKHICVRAGVVGAQDSTVKDDGRGCWTRMIDEDAGR